jgi:rubrerythrin
MTVEEAINTAIEYETRVRDVYAGAVERTTDPVGKRIFKVLAGEEQHHLEYLQAKLDQWRTTGKVTAEGLKTSIPSKEVLEAGVKRLETHLSTQDRGVAELQILKRALEVESETGSFYKKMVRELPAEGQELFSRFVEIEEGHLAIVQAELDYASGTGFWFDFQEFDLEGA